MHRVRHRLDGRVHRDGRAVSYAKLFGHILHSTIWQQPDHVRIVWITMLALKDADGIVQASIPGLAKASGETLSDTQNALAVLLSPDEFSRTKDHEGRRIAEVDGGWRVLNHEKYRDMEDQEDRRRKDAERQARKRERDRHAASRDVTPSHAKSRESRKITPSDTDTHVLQRGERGGSGSGSSSGPSEASSGSPRDLVQGPLDRGAARGRGFAVPPPNAAHGSTVPPVASDSPADALPDAELRQLVWGAEKRINAARRDVATAYGLDPGRHQHPTAQDTADAMARLRESGATAASDLDHVLAMAVADARKKRTLEHLGWCIFRANAWSAKMRATEQSVAKSGERRSAFEVADEVFDELARKEREAES